MTDETNAGKKEEHGKIDSAPIGKVQPVDPPSPPIIGAGTQEKITGKPGCEKPKDKCDKSKEILVRLIKDDALSQFERKTLFWGRIGIVLTVITLAVGIVTLVVFYRQLSVMQTGLDEAESESRATNRHARQQLREMQAQVDAVQRQMRQDQRAWLALTMDWPTVKDAKGEIIGKVVHVTENQPLVVPMRLTNSGKTIARIVQADIFVEVVKTVESPHLGSGNGAPWQFSAGIILPNTPSDFPAYRQEPKKTGLEAMFQLTPTENQDLSTGRAYLAVHGKMTYRDVFGFPHWTKFCGWVPLNPSPRYYNSKKCSDYNDVDND